MQFNIPKVVRPLFLKDYAEGFGVDPETGNDVPLWVWVNPPRGLLRERDEIVAEIIRRSTQRLIDLKKSQEENGETQPAEEQPDAVELIEESFTPEEMANLDEQLYAWLSKIWSQGPDGSHLSAEEIKQLATDTSDTDPDFFAWAQRRTVEMIVAHRQGQKKS